MIVTLNRWTRVRMVVLGLGFGALFVLIGRRAFQLQVRDSEHLKSLAEDQYLREIELPPKRGRILDRNQAELASTAEVDSIYCNPRQLPDLAAASRQLARALGLDGRELEKRLSQKRFFAWVKRKVTPEEAQAVKQLGLPGIGFTREPRRFYANRSLAATVMGYAGAEGRGLDGIELALEKQLRGTRASVQGVRDALGRELLLEPGAGVTSLAGADVVLTLDRYLQYVTEKAIAEAQTAHHAKAVMAVMLDPRNGDVLAMASMPTFNPNDPGSVAEAGARNRVITDAFEPGSTMKTFTISAALDAGAVRPEDFIDCQMGRMQVGKFTVHDTHPHGAITVSDVFKFSSNIGASKIARRLGRERFSQALERFGFGHPTGVELPGERAGVVRPVEKWGDIGLANVSFGQGLTATPLQIAAGVAAIASGGVYHSPRLVSRIVRPDGTEEPSPERPSHRVISEKAARQMVAIMRGVTEVGGTARTAAVDGYPVAGKTGTAQKVAHGHYDPNRWVSSFVGFLPAQDPRITLLVMFDEPQGEGGHLGGAVAGPVFKEIAEQAMRYLHVPPQALAEAGGASRPALGGPAAPSRTARVSPASPVADAADGDDSPGSDEASLDEDGRPVDADAAESLAAAEAVEGETAAGEDDPQDRTRWVTVPDVRGLTLGAALKIAAKNGLELAFDERAGLPTGVARAQEPLPGPAPRGRPLRVSFASVAAP
jgi:cell division protein FtsI (penicillin-binding protein 3)